MWMSGRRQMSGWQKSCYIQPLCCGLVWAALALVWVSVRPGVTHEIKQSSVHNHYNNHIFQRWQIGLNVATKSYNKDLQQLQISLLSMAGENTAKLSRCPRTVQCMGELTPPLCWAWWIGEAGAHKIIYHNKTAITHSILIVQKCQRYRLNRHDEPDRIVTSATWWLWCLLRYRPRRPSTIFPYIWKKNWTFDLSASILIVQKIQSYHWNRDNEPERFVCSAAW